MKKNNLKVFCSHRFAVKIVNLVQSFHFNWRHQKNCCRQLNYFSNVLELVYTFQNFLYHLSIFFETLPNRKVRGEQVGKEFIPSYVTGIVQKRK